MRLTHIRSITWKFITQDVAGGVVAGQPGSCKCTVYYESFEASRFLHVHKTFNIRWRCSNMDLRESMWDSVKVFREGLCVQLAAKLFFLKTFMVYGITMCVIIFI